MIDKISAFYSGAANRVTGVLISSCILAAKVSEAASAVMVQMATPLIEISLGALELGLGVAVMAHAYKRGDKPLLSRIAAASLGLGCVVVGCFSLSQGIDELVGFDKATPADPPPPYCPVSFQPHPFLPPKCTVDAKKVIVACRVANGDGDLRGCHQIWRAIDKSHPCDSIELGIEKALEKAILRRSESDFERVTFFGSFKEVQDKYDLIVTYPTFSNRPNLDADRSTILASDKPYLSLFEYGFGTSASDLNKLMQNRSSMAFSLGPGGAGFIIDPDLRLSHQKRRANISEREFLALLPDSWQRAVLGEPYSYDLGRRFFNKWSLHLSYTWDARTKDAFLQVVSNVVATSTRQPCFLFVGKPISPISEPLAGVPFVERHPIRYMKRMGFTKIELHLPSPDDVTVFNRHTFNLTEGSGPLAKLVFLPKMARMRFLHLLRASDRMSSATGDQSASEFIFAGLFTLYEKLEHKNEFVQGFIEIAHNFDQKIGLIIETLFNTFDGMMEIDKRNWSRYGVKEYVWPKKSIEAAIGAFNQLNSHMELWDRFVDYLYKYHNALERIIETVDGYLYR